MGRYYDNFGVLPAGNNLSADWGYGNTQWLSMGPIFGLRPTQNPPPAVAIYGLAAPTQNHRVKVWPRIAAYDLAGDQGPIGAIARATDENNFYYAQITLVWVGGAPFVSLQLWKRVAGINTFLVGRQDASAGSINEPLKLSVQNTQIRATYYGHSLVATDASLLTGNYGGIYGYRASVWPPPGYIFAALAAWEQSWGADLPIFLSVDKDHAIIPTADYNLDATSGTENGYGVYDLSPYTCTNYGNGILYVGSGGP